MQGDVKEPFTLGDWAAAGLLVLTGCALVFRYANPDLAEEGIWAYIRSPPTVAASGRVR